MCKASGSPWHEMLLRSVQFVPQEIINKTRLISFVSKPIKVLVVVVVVVDPKTIHRKNFRPKSVGSKKNLGKIFFSLQNRCTKNLRPKSVGSKKKFG